MTRWFELWLDRILRGLAVTLTLLLVLSVVGTAAVYVMMGPAASVAPAATPPVLPASAATPGHETRVHEVVFDKPFLGVLPSVRWGSYSIPLLERPPPDFGGVVVEVVWDAPTKAAGLGDLRVVAFGEGSRFSEADEPNDDGVLVLTVDAKRYTYGALSLWFEADSEGGAPNVVVGNARVYTTVFHGAPPPEGFSAVPR